MKKQVILTGNELKQLIESRANSAVKQIIETKNKQITQKKKENLSNMITEKIMSYTKKLNEGISCYDYGEISDALAECGWAYSDAYDVHRGDEQGVRYIIEPYPNNLNGVKPMDVEEMKQKMTELIGEENVIFSEGQHRHAPEIKNLSMIVIDNCEDDGYYGESIKRKQIKESWELDQLNYHRDRVSGKFNGQNPLGGKFNIQDEVKFTSKSGKEITGFISDVDYNYMTYDLAYDIDVELNGKKQTIIGVPENVITLVKPYSQEG